MSDYGGWNNRQIAEMFTQNAYCLMRDCMEEFVENLDTGQLDEGCYAVDWEEKRSISSVLKAEHYIDSSCFGHAVMQLRRIVRAVELGKFEILDVSVKKYTYDQKTKNLLLDIKTSIAALEKRLTVPPITSRPSFKFDTKETFVVSTHMGNYKAVYWKELADFKQEWDVKLDIENDDDDLVRECEYEHEAPNFAPEAYLHFFNLNVSYKSFLKGYNGFSGRFSDDFRMEVLI